jgi:hypothetical protein
MEPSTTAVVGRIGPKLQEELSLPRHAAEPDRATFEDLAAPTEKSVGNGVMIRGFVR